MPDLDSLVAFAHELADGAREILRARFRSIPDFEIKDDSTPVTVADRECEALLRERIRARFPAHGILGEEAEPENPDAALRWVLDPIDGTKNFATGKPIFGALIALWRGDDPLLGVIEAPITAERWVGADGRPTAHQGRPVRTRPARPLEECVLYTTSPDLFHGARAAAFQRLRRAVRLTLYGADCYAYGMLARGDIDLVVEDGLHPWDVGALVPVVRGAGGVATTWEGEPPTLAGETGLLAASCEDVALAARRVLGCA